MFQQLPGNQSDSKAPDEEQVQGGVMSAFKIK